MIGTTINFKRKPIKKITIKDGIVLFILLAYIVGFIIGVSLIANRSTTFFNFTETVFSQLIESKSSSSFFKLVFGSFLSFFPYILGAYFFGTGILGCAVIPAVCVIRGIFNGLLVSYVYNVYAINGMGFTVLILAPYIIISAYLLILASRESIFFSDRILKNALPKGTAFNLSIDFKFYSIRYVFICVFSLLASVLDATLTTIFFEYFNL